MCARVTQYGVTSKLVSCVFVACCLPLHAPTLDSSSASLLEPSLSGRHPKWCAASRGDVRDSVTCYPVLGALTLNKFITALLATAALALPKVPGVPML